MSISKHNRRNQLTTSKAQSHRWSSRARLLALGGGIVAIVVLGVMAVALAAPAPAQPAGAPGAQAIEAPDFSLSLYQGQSLLGNEPLRFSDVFSQGKPVVLNFWAGLCPPCRAEMPFFQNVYDSFGGDFILLGLDIGPFIGLGSSEDGQSLLRELGITYPAGTTSEPAAVSAYKLRGMPTTVFLTSHGAIFEVHAGILSEAALREKVERLLEAEEAS